MNTLVSRHKVIGRKTGSKGQGVGKNKGKQEEEPKKAKRRFGHTVRYGKWAPWDFELDQEYKGEATTQPPPPKLSSIKIDKAKAKKVEKAFAGLTTADINKLAATMAEEEGEEQVGEPEKTFFTYDKMGGQAEDAKVGRSRRTQETASQVNPNIWREKGGAKIFTSLKGGGEKGVSKN